MKTSWEPIAECLRNEVAEYGRLLSLYAEQQNLIFKRDPETVLQLAHTIKDQVGILDRARAERESRVRAFAAEVGQEPGATLRSLLVWVAPEVRPLFEALITDVNLLIHRIRRSSRLNHRLLSSMVECHQEVLRRLRPDAFTLTYSPSGRLAVGAAGRSPSIQTAG
jgi:flagellar biosynthesis/type III secretory pathway chaperone